MKYHIRQSLFINNLLHLITQVADKFKCLNCFFKALTIGCVEQIFMKSFISSTNFIVEILFPVFKGIRPQRIIIFRNITLLKIEAVRFFCEL